MIRINTGKESVVDWVNSNKHRIYCELLTSSEKLVRSKRDSIAAIKLYNLSHDVTITIAKQELPILLNKGMQHFLECEEYEQCARIRDLVILIKNKK